ncbi:ATP-dependent metallopeptidase FtsH/Yme1/Tma family protein [Actinacidiphila soli]|uniref:ATP-dependent metallopeptidase FtsH/Yme1/Tma family protein n=1 Tax=Actinacidiphila soli TaxID=2487275 RepID=UPI002B00243C|nr:ATP-dependent metallopeptidase FtsH/Yme1/Tma family protein [Actinacidiphila soli]
MITSVRLPGRCLTRSAKPGPPREPPPKPPSASQAPSWRPWLIPVAIMITLLVVLGRIAPSRQGASLSYSEFLGKVGAGQVKTVVVP